MLLCCFNRNPVRCLAAEGFLSRNRCTLTISVLPHGAIEEDFVAFSPELTSNPVFRDDRLEQVLSAEPTTLDSLTEYQRWCADLQGSDNWDAETPSSVARGRSAQIQAVECGAGSGLGTFDTIYVRTHYRDDGRFLHCALQPGGRRKPLTLLSADPNLVHNLVSVSESLMHFRGDSYLFGAYEGRCMNRSLSTGGDRKVSYKWTNANGGLLPAHMDGEVRIQWCGVLVGPIKRELPMASTTTPSGGTTRQLHSEAR